MLGLGSGCHRREQHATFHMELSVVDQSTNLGICNTYEWQDSAKACKSDSALFFSRKDSRTPRASLNIRTLRRGPSLKNDPTLISRCVGSCWRSRDADDELIFEVAPGKPFQAS